MTAGSLSYETATPIGIGQNSDPTPPPADGYAYWQFTAAADETLAITSELSLPAAGVATAGASVQVYTGATSDTSVVEASGYGYTRASGSKQLGRTLLNARAGTTYVVGVYAWDCAAVILTVAHTTTTALYTAPDPYSVQSTVRPESGYTESATFEKLRNPDAEDGQQEAQGYFDEAVALAGSQPHSSTGDATLLGAKVNVSTQYESSTTYQRSTTKAVLQQGGAHYPSSPLPSWSQPETAWPDEAYSLVAEPLQRTESDIAFTGLFTGQPVGTASNQSPHQSAITATVDLYLTGDQGVQYQIDEAYTRWHVDGDTWPVSVTLIPGDPGFGFDEGYTMSTTLRVDGVEAVRHNGEAVYEGAASIDYPDLAFGFVRTDHYANPQYRYVVAVMPGSGEISWWDGTARQPATVNGWWDGTAVQPVNLLGWWDGTQIQPVLGGS